MFETLNPLHMSFIIFCSTAFAVLFYMFYKFCDIDGEKDGKESYEVIDKSPNSLENRILNILTSETDETKRQESLHRIAGDQVSIAVKMRVKLLKLVNNPYNKISVPKMLIWCILGSVIGLLLGITLQNVSAMVSLTIIGVSFPFTLVSLLALKNQMRVLESNLGLIMTHLGIYKESESFVDSLNGTLLIMTPGTREYEIVNATYLAVTEGSLPILKAIDMLKRNLLADSNIKQYFDICEIAETVSPDYKDSLDYIPTRLEPLVRVNMQFVTISLALYFIYLILSVVCIIVLLYYRFIDKETNYYLIHTSLGQIGTFVCMFALVIIGWIIGKFANIITYDKLGREEE